MSLAWQAQKERGSRPAIRFMAWVALTLGRPTARLFLHPICLYYLLLSRKANRAIKTFYQRAVAHPADWLALYHHYLSFASTILDRVYFLRGRFDLFEVTVHGSADLDRMLAQGRGCILLGSHLGSFEAVRAVGLSQRGEILVLMDEHNAPLIRTVTQELSPEVAHSVIQVGGPETMLQVKECLERGGIVGMMGDRVTQEARSANCLFLGEPAKFPSGAMRLAHVVHAPIVLFFGLYRGGNRYDVYLEPFSDGLRLSDSARDAEVRHWTQVYADRLAVYCRRAPNNWFNFYDFWSRTS